jgi:hypothetical protein
LPSSRVKATVIVDEACSCVVFVNDDDGFVQHLVMAAVVLVACAALDDEVTQSTTNPVVVLTCDESVAIMAKAIHHLTEHLEVVLLLLIAMSFAL